MILKKEESLLEILLLLMTQIFYYVHLLKMSIINLMIYLKIKKVKDQMVEKLMEVKEKLMEVKEQMMEVKVKDPLLESGAHRQRGSIVGKHSAVVGQLQLKRQHILQVSYNDGGIPGLERF